MKIDRLWERLNFLVPEPNCKTSENDTAKIQWFDQRTKPTNAALNAVTDEELDSNALDAEANNSLATKSDKLILEVLLDMENRIRGLEGKSPVDKPTYKNTLKDIYKEL